MYKTLMLLLVLLVSAAWVQAQAYPQSEPTQSTAGASGNSGTAGHMMVEGCLSGSDGNYTLTADNGTMYQLTGNTAELKDHVGHEVQITGKTSGSSMSGSTSSSASSSTSPGQSQTLDVKSMKHISKTCKSGGTR